MESSILPIIFKLLKLVSSLFEFENIVKLIFGYLNNFATFLKFYKILLFERIIHQYASNKKKNKLLELGFKKSFADFEQLLSV